MVGKDKGIGEFEDRTIEIPNLKKKKRKRENRVKKLTEAQGPVDLQNYFLICIISVLHNLMQRNRDSRNRPTMYTQLIFDKSAKEI